MKKFKVIFIINISGALAMCKALLQTYHLDEFFESSPQLHEVDTIVISSEEMGKLRYRKAERLAQRPTTMKWQKRVLQQAV